MSFSAANLNGSIQNSLLFCLPNNVISTFASMKLEQWVARNPSPVCQLLGGIMQQYACFLIIFPAEQALSILSYRMLNKYTAKWPNLVIFSPHLGMSIDIQNAII